MTRNCSIFDLRWPLGDRDHLRQLASWSIVIGSSSAHLDRAETAGKLASQLTTTWDKEGLIDRLVTHPHHRIVWERYALARAVAMELTTYRAEHKLSQTALA